MIRTPKYTIFVFNVGHHYEEKKLMVIENGFSSIIHVKLKKVIATSKKQLD